jgi:sec-independent protein translocase protein TatB
MFGIGLPEMIVILAVALLVVGPDKLPELARSLAKGVNELKNTMNQVKDSLHEETKVVSSVQQELQQTAGQMKTRMLENVTTPPNQWKQEGEGTTDTAFTQEDEVIEGEAPYSSWPKKGTPIAQAEIDRDDRSSEQLEGVKKPLKDGGDGGESVELDVEFESSKRQKTEEKDPSASGPASVS